MAQTYKGTYDLTALVGPVPSRCCGALRYAFPSTGTSPFRRSDLAFAVAEAIPSIAYEGNDALFTSGCTST